MSHDWSIERVLGTADKAVGVDVLTRMHDEWGRSVTPDLASLWRDLGLKLQEKALNSTIPRRSRRSASPSPRRGEIGCVL